MRRFIQDLDFVANADFAQKCEDHGIVFIGPSAETIRRMGDKQEARRLMMLHQIPIVPGSKGIIETVEDACIEAKRIGYQFY